MDLSFLYRQVIMDHYKNPRNKGLINDANYLSIQMNNPSCGDDIVVQMKVEDGKIIDIKHDGKGCSICCSSASVMSEALIGLNKEKAIIVVNEFYELVKGMPFNEAIIQGDILAYQGVANFPARIKCATLAWKAIEKGIDERMNDGR
ncbi:SUF system NifU family Fe-S cluster assembly protein [Acholeplasma sp. OttesenSCG-928-E16]|nr:SUF system NifU family Fe-S cluster assembly protein [Acholeplasma sp. OttesenSCG-928-E16]